MLVVAHGASDALRLGLSTELEVLTNGRHENVRLKSIIRRSLYQYAGERKNGEPQFKLIRSAVLPPFNCSS